MLNQRRLEKDIFDESVTEFKKDESINNQQIDVGQVKTTKGQEVSAESSKVLLNEDKQDVTQARNKYGIKENEVESITDDDDVCYFFQSFWIILFINVCVCLYVSMYAHGTLK